MAEHTPQDTLVEEPEIDNEQEMSAEEVDNEIETLIDFSSISIGEYFAFGVYEQDNDLTNGKEPIEWLVLDVQDGEDLLLS